MNKITKNGEDENWGIRYGDEKKEKLLGEVWEYHKQADNLFHGRFGFFLAANLLLFVIGYINQPDASKELIIVGIGMFLTYWWYKINVGLSKKIFALMLLLRKMSTAYKAYMDIPEFHFIIPENIDLFNKTTLKNTVEENYKWDLSKLGSSFFILPVYVPVGVGIVWYICLIISLSKPCSVAAIDRTVTLLLIHIQNQLLHWNTISYLIYPLTA